MKEREIRERVATFLRKTAKTVVLPAAMGLGLGLGCGSDRTTKEPKDGGSDAKTVVNDPNMDYAAPFYPDYGANFANTKSDPDPDAAVPSDGGADVDDAEADVIEAKPLYAAPMPEPDASA